MIKNTSHKSIGSPDTPSPHRTHSIHSTPSTQSAHSTHNVLKSALSAALLLLMPPSALADIYGRQLLSIDNTDSVISAIVLAPMPKRVHVIKNSKELGKCREKVWKEWASKIINSVDNKLLPDFLHPLGSDTTAIWNIPASLEPDARMLMRYGFKPDSTGKVSGKPPLFIYLHGSGPRDKEWATGLKLAQRFDDAPSIYIIPRISNEGAWYRWYQRGKQQAIESWLRLSLARGVDPDRIYIFGISEGGYGSQRLASFYADYLAGAGPMAGGEPLRNAPAENLRNIAFSLLTGDNDTGFYRNYLTQITKNVLDSLENENPGYYNHRIELIPGKGHGIDYTPTTPWLVRHKRNAMSRCVSWENYEMDGRKRNAFYNLAVVEPKGKDTDGADLRTRYELVIDSASNTVSLNVDRVHYTVTQTDPNWGIQLTFAKNYEPAKEGFVRVYLAPELLDLSKPVHVVANGHDLGSVRLHMTEENLRETAMLFGDPSRLFPASITINLATASMR